MKLSLNNGKKFSILFENITHCYYTVNNNNIKYRHLSWITSKFNRKKNCYSWANRNSNYSSELCIKQTHLLLSNETDTPYWIIDFTKIFLSDKIKRGKLFYVSFSLDIGNCSYLWTTHQIIKIYDM